MAEVEERHRLKPIPQSIRTLSNEESERLSGMFPSASSGPDDCPTCRGNREFRWYTPDREEVVTYECSCVDQWVLNRYLLWSGVGLNYQRLGWADIEQQAKVTKVQEWLEVAQHAVGQGMGLLLTGDKGTGKTLLSTLVFRYLLGIGNEGYWTTFNAMIDHHTDAWRDKEERRWYNRRIKNAPILVIDDLGKENRGAEFIRTALDEVIRHRVAQGAATILTTNDDPDGVAAAYGGYVSSLLTEHVDPMEINGEDFRPRARKRLHEEVKAGLTRPVVLM